MLPAAFTAAVLDPPQVHPNSDIGVWRSEQSCYEFIGRHVDQTSNTLETGLGLSTVAFAMLGSQHISVYLEPSEGEQLEEWAKTHDVDLSRIELRSGGSDRVLSQLAPAPLDLVFIDGCHGYPLPQLDFMHACSHLKRGGVLVIDDTQLWAPRQLRVYLDADPRWQGLERTAKWAAFRRESQCSLVEDFAHKPFGIVPEPMFSREWMRQFPGRAQRKLRRTFESISSRSRS
jgi:hypothetical protein